MFFLSAIFYPRWSLAICFLLAIAWAFVHQTVVAPKGMPLLTVIPKAVLVGKIVSIPTAATTSQFQVLLSKLNGKPVKALVLMRCYAHCQQFKVGQVWQMQAKLKRPRDLGNPGHFHYEQGLSARHIYWTGTLNAKATWLKQEASWETSLLQGREHLSKRLKNLLPDKTTFGIVQALTLGLGQDIDVDLWALFRRTGTTHLMVISGAHISLVAGMMVWLIRRLWSSVPSLTLWVPGALVAAPIALFCVFAYALFAGFAIPAQRALVACFILMSCTLFNRRFSAWQSWRYALLLVLILEPHAVLLPGAYLSFLAVACLMTAGARLKARGLRKSLSLQLACLLGLLPFTLFWFSYGALTGFFANLVAIPLVAYLLLPLSLLLVPLGMLLSKPWIVLPLTFVVKVLVQTLAIIDKLSLVNVSLTFQQIPQLLALFTALTIFFLAPLPAYLPQAVLLLSMSFFPHLPRIKPNEAQIDVIDVGQGLAVLVSTEKHHLVYDTGMKFFQGSDMASMAIIPYLETRGLKKIDMLVISHPDLDHRGGLESLEARFPIDQFVVDKVAFYHRGQPCHHYPAWVWDGISFEFLPIHAVFRDKNNSSCVLKVSSASAAMLLTGDIERLAEYYLLGTVADKLAADVLLVAHHGSKTSSVPSFIHEVAPKFAVISAGLDNKYHFPHPQTVDTFKRAKITLLNTMNCGMVSITLPHHHLLEKPRCWAANN